MSFSIEQLTEMIRGTKSLSAVSRLLMPENERRLLMYCASVRMFDRKLVNKFFRPEINGADEKQILFQKLISYDFVERIPRTDDFYRLNDTARREYFNLWWSESNTKPSAVRRELPLKLFKLSKKLIAYYIETGQKLEELYHCITIRKAEAKALFLDLYKKADQKFDLGTCRDLINTLEERKDVSNISLSRLAQDHEVYLNARSRWASEYDQTEFYYSRASIKSEFEELLAPTEKWIIDLHAPGGSGKTMSLRWLISRRCVPEPYRIPCARIDFDSVSPVENMQNPWRLFLKIASQLDEQIPGKYFYEIVEWLTEFEEILLKSNASDTLSPQSAIPLEKLKKEVPLRIAKALKEANLNRPVVLIFDTLEEVVLYHQSSVMALIEQINQLHNTYNNIRLILSGRYAISDRIPEFRNKYKDQLKEVELKPFFYREAFEYLTQTRGVKEENLPLGLIDKANGNPFKLALIADILLDSGLVLTDETTNSYKEIDLIYLIKRVVKRIKNPQVRWLLRYGVIPRNLTLTFFKKVMSKHLPAVMSGNTNYDNVREGIPCNEKPEDIFSTDILKSSNEKIDTDALWETLLTYASRSSWVSLINDDRQTLLFHNDVVNPMRRLVQKQKIYKILHKEAVRYFERKAEADPENWVKWTKEAVYHKFQLEGNKAEKYWMHNLLSRKAQLNPRWRLELAREVIGSDYLDENEMPFTMRNGNPLISYEAVIKAHYEIARAALEIVRNPSVVLPEIFRSEAETSVKKVEALQEKHKIKAISPNRIAIIKASILTYQHDYSSALLLVEKALATEANPTFKFQLAIEHGRINSSAHKIQEAIDSYRFALENKPSEIRTSEITALKKEIALLYQQLRQTGKAIDEFIDVFRTLEEKGHGNGSEAIEIRYNLANLYYDSGQYSAALAHTRIIENGAFPEVNPIERVRFYYLQAKTLLMIGEPLKALKLCGEGLQITDTLENRSDNSFSRSELRARGLELQGVILTELMDSNNALDSLQEARILWKDCGKPEKSNRCLLRQIEVHLSVTGNISEAAQHIEDAQKFTIQTEPSEWLRQQLLLHNILLFQNKTEEAYKVLERLVNLSAKENWSPQNMIHVLVIILKYSLPERINENANELLEMLKKIDPPAARLDFARYLYSNRSLDKLDPKIADSIIETLVIPGETEIDFSVNALRKIKVLIWTGKKEEALNLLDKVFERLVTDGGGILIIEALWLGGSLYLDPDFLKRATPLVQKLAADFADYPLLCGKAFLSLTVNNFLNKIESAYDSINTAADYFQKAKAERSNWMAMAENFKFHFYRILITSEKPFGYKASIKKLVSEADFHLKKASEIFAALGDKYSVKYLSQYFKWLENIANDTEAHQYVSQEKDSAELQVILDAREKTIVTQIEFNPDNRGLNIKTNYLDYDMQSASREIEEFHPSISALIDDASEVYSYSFIEEFISDDKSLWRRLEKAIFDHSLEIALSYPTRNTQPEIRLHTKKTQLAAIPWEALAYTYFSRQSDSYPELKDLLSNDFLYCYRGQSDSDFATGEIDWIKRSIEKIYGIYETNDAKFMKFLRNFHTDNNLSTEILYNSFVKKEIKRALRLLRGYSQPQVLVLQPSLSREIKIDRGSQNAGLKTARFYEFNNFNVHTIENPEYHELGYVIEKHTPDIIHIISPLKESYTFGVYIDFADSRISSRQNYEKDFLDNESRLYGDEAERNISQLTASALSDLLKRVSNRNGEKPIVIFDPPRPSGQSEIVRQIFLRNSFCSKLFNLGQTESILGIGFEQPHKRASNLETLTSGLANPHLSIGGVYHSFQKNAVSDVHYDKKKYFPETYISELANCLFTNFPDL